MTHSSHSALNVVVTTTVSKHSGPIKKMTLSIAGTKKTITCCVQTLDSSAGAQVLPPRQVQKNLQMRSRPHVNVLTRQGGSKVSGQIESFEILGV